MARLSPSALVGEIRGKVRGVVFTKGRSGATVRIRVTPANPRSSAQSAIRAYLTSAARAWKAFSAGTVLDWEEAASAITKTNPISGSSYSPTGINYYTSLTTKFLQISPAGSPPSTPPASAFSGDDIAVTAVGASGKITFTGSAANASGVKTELLVQKLKSANRKPNPGGYRTQTFFAFAGGSLSHDVTLSPGDYVPAYRFVKTSTGQEVGMIVLPAVTVT